MAFLDKADYEKQIKDEILDEVTDGTDATIDDAELAAQAEMESYLASRYDVANIFNKSGNARNPLILMYMIDISLYHLHARVNPRNIPDIRRERYERAIKWLEMVAAGELSPGGSSDASMPPRTDADGNPLQNWRMGSNTKFNNEW